MKIKEASDLLGISEQVARWLCRTGHIGTCYLAGNGERATFYVFEDKVAQMLGISVDEMKRRMKNAKEHD